MTESMPLEDMTIRLLRARDAVGEAQNEVEALCEATNGMEMLKYFHLKSDLGTMHERLEIAYRDAHDKQVASIPGGGDGG